MGTNQVKQAGSIPGIGGTIVKGAKDFGRKEHTVQLSNDLGSHTKGSSVFYKALANTDSNTY